MFSKALWFYFVHHDGNRNNSGDEKWSSLVKLAKGPFFYLRLSPDAFASRDKNSKPEWSAGHAVFSGKWEVSCVSQEEGTVVKDQVPVGFLVLKRQIQVDHSCRCAAGCWDNL